jgi:uncharacterized membrane protein YkoI
MLQMPLPAPHRPSTMPVMLSETGCHTSAARRAGLRLAILLAFCSCATVSQAQESLVKEGISEDAAVARVREQTDGKVVRVDRKIDGGLLVYRVRVLSADGRLREYLVDAATGSIR